MVRLKIAIRVLLIGVCLSVTLLAQTPLEAKPICDNSTNAVQITFDHVETLAVVNGKPTNAYWFKIRNNSRCGIEIGVPEEFIHKKFVRPRIARDETGKVIINTNGGYQIDFYSNVEFKDGDKVQAIYHLTNSHLKSVGAGNYEGCVVRSITMQSGQAFLFSVTSPTFKKNHNVEVMFGYVGEKRVSYEPYLRHKVTFAFNDIPQEAIKSKK